jgi:hypothetical protein
LLTHSQLNRQLLPRQAAHSLGSESQAHPDLLQGNTDDGENSATSEREARGYSSPSTNPRTTYSTSQATMGLKSKIPTGGRSRRIGSISQLVSA